MTTTTTPAAEFVRTNIAAILDGTDNTGGRWLIARYIDTARNNGFDPAEFARESLKLAYRAGRHDTADKIVDVVLPALADM